MRTEVSKTTLNVWFDVTLLVLVSATIGSAFVDTHLHTWLGLSMIVVIGVHLVLHWAWLKAIGKRFFNPMAFQVRMKVLVDIVLLATLLVMTGSGMIVSLIYAPSVTRFHAHCFYLFLGLLLVHMALNRKWIMVNVGHQLRSVLKRSQ